MTNVQLSPLSPRSVATCLLINGHITEGSCVLLMEAGDDFT
jgi:hypothetical protein